MKTTQAAKATLLALLRGYKRAISPWLPPSCRYTPTCSEFAIEAIDRYGAVRGSAMAAWRVLRCHPLARGGYDPVPWTEATSAPVSSSFNDRRGLDRCTH